MSRTDVTKVAGILADNWDGKTGLQPFIDAANQLVTTVLSNDEDAVVTAANAEIIERWLSAHFYAVQDPLYISKNTGKAGASFHGKSNMDLSFTPYGQQAKKLDPSGYLEALDNKGLVNVVWVGKPPSTQIPYRDRD